MIARFTAVFESERIDGEEHWFNVLSQVLEGLDAELIDVTEEGTADATRRSR